MSLLQIEDKNTEQGATDLGTRSQAEVFNTLIIQRVKKICAP
jgi:hypothetical protein